MEGPWSDAAYAGAAADDARRTAEGAHARLDEMDRDGSAMFAAADKRIRKLEKRIRSMERKLGITSP